MTYLELVNTVLRKLRQTEVSTVSQNAYSKLIGDFINEAKREVEDSYNWNALTQTLTQVTVADLFNGVLVGSGQRFKVLDVINDTTNTVMQYRPSRWMDQQFLTVPVQKGEPVYYNFNGVDQYGDTQVDIFPVPDSSYTIRYNIFMPSDPFTLDSESLRVPYEPVVQNAYARALVERGEDGGMNSSEAYAMARQILADCIAIESNRYPEEGEWYAI